MDKCKPLATGSDDEKEPSSSAAAAPATFVPVADDAATEETEPSATGAAAGAGDPALVSATALDAALAAADDAGCDCAHSGRPLQAHPSSTGFTMLGTSA